MKTIIASGASHAEFQANSQAKKMPGDLTRKCIYRSTTRNLYNSIKSNFIVSVQTSRIYFSFSLNFNFTCFPLQTFS